MEWLEDLEFADPVEISGDARLAVTSWHLRSADFDPFEDLIELVLDDGSGLLRVILEGPLEILVDGDERHPDAIQIRTSEGVFEMAEARALTPTKAPARAHRRPGAVTA
jgi:hypothetical protein